ncbi:MAG TPA: serine/threonine-protein kinase [Bryobacteraceae bacterium]|nr:serine/threonine-protein kinase [Bryobacteraceae bacterium]
MGTQAAPQFTRTVDAGGTVAMPQKEPTRTSRLSVTSTSDDEGRFVPGTLVAGRYRVIGLLGRGGMGEVYRATDLTLGQSVALKFLPEEATRDERWLERFHNEVRTARQVTHPNVCRVYDIGEADGLPFISMEYVDGEDLASLLQRIGRLPASKALEITRKLCLGLAAAHDRGIIHRDLKPHNIMLNKRGDVVIMDFGLAAIADRLEGAEARSGTAAYMAPEQLRGDSVTAASDLYSLGLIAYELFTGRRAFEGESIMDLLHAQESTAPVPITSAAPDVDSSVEQAVLRCLDPDPRMRPAGARSVVAALPGGDPLAAALAAGETPSPELVAASGRVTGMRTRYAVACLVLVLAGLFVIPYIWSAQSVFALAPMDYPPDVLKQKARDIASSFGVKTPALDWAGRFQGNSEAMQYLGKHRNGKSWPELLRAVSPIEFWYRQSAQYLIAAPDGIVSAGRPAPDSPGMAYVVVDSAGRLRRFQAVTSRFDESLPEVTPAVDPSAVFAAAGLDMAKFTEKAPSYAPALPYDTRRAWTGPFPTGGSDTITLEIAMRRGAVTSVFIRWPWTSTKEGQAPQDLRQMGFTLFYFAMCGVGLFCAAFFARRNLRSGRGDRKGATRIAIAALVLSAFETAGWIHIAPVFDMAGFVLLRLAAGLLFAAILWLLYIALEPSIRSRWPQSLVTWSRLTGGNWRDPGVASHVLLGSALGVVWLCLFVARNFTDGWLPGGPPAHLLSGVREVVARVAVRASTALLWGAALFFLLCGVRALVRKDWIAIGVSALLMTFVEGSVRNSQNLALDVPLYVSLYVAFMFMLIRAGQLPAIVAILVLNTFGDMPISGSFNAWFNWILALQMTLIAGLAIYAFVRSQASVPSVGPRLSSFRHTPRAAAASGSR